MLFGIDRREQMSSGNSATMVPAAFLVALGIAVGGYFVSKTVYNGKVGINTAEVKGLAERRVEADRGYWAIQYVETGNSREEVAKLYERSEADQNEVMALLKESGFEDSEIKPGILNYQEQEFRDEGQRVVDVKYVVTGSIEVETDKVKLLPDARTKMNELVKKGMNLRNNAPMYYFTKLNDIKPEMVKEATTNARIAANEFAANAGVKVGGIRDARQGGFTIVDAGERVGDTRKIEKDVRVVTTITFYLTE